MGRQKAIPKKTTHSKKREFCTLSHYKGMKRAMKMAKDQAKHGDSSDLNVLKSIRKSFRKKARRGGIHP